ncbi:unnamed protein product [Symbiodinium natans]|uniref:Uncharacterized protein n=1 Tax=Symbiodinium natans TaxID=878477 RepID=A0A812IE06_9DINO|nr:unnamed protein product [Symbiodinium natans]
MAPLEDLHSRDLAWISDFVMQQVVLMMRPMMDHLQQTDSSLDYAQRQVHRVNMDLVELKADVDRTNKYLAILRQGLGVQNEGKCVIQRSLESNTRTVKRLDEQMESMLTVLRGVEESFEQLCTDFRGARAQHEDLSQKVTEHTVALDDMQTRVDKICDASPSKEEVPNGEARIEVWHRELRELRRNQIGFVPKLEEKGKASAQDPWPRKTFTAVEVAPPPHGPGPFPAGSLVEAHSGSSQGPKRSSRVSSTGRQQLLSQDPFVLGVPGRHPRVWQDDAPDPGCTEPEEEDSERLPRLSSRPTARVVERSSGNAEAPRLRFAATMAQPPSRGK